MKEYESNEKLVSLIFLSFTVVDTFRNKNIHILLIYSLVCDSTRSNESFSTIDEVTRLIRRCKFSTLHPVEEHVRNEKLAIDRRFGSSGENPRCRVFKKAGISGFHRDESLSRAGSVTVSCKPTGLFIFVSTFAASSSLSRERSCHYLQA